MSRPKELLRKRITRRFYARSSIFPKPRIAHGDALNTRDAKIHIPAPGITFRRLSSLPLLQTASLLNPVSTLPAGREDTAQ